MLVGLISHGLLVTAKYLLLLRAILFSFNFILYVFIRLGSAFLRYLSFIFYALFSVFCFLFSVFCLKSSVHPSPPIFTYFKALDYCDNNCSIAFISSVLNCPAWVSCCFDCLSLLWLFL